MDVEVNATQKRFRKEGLENFSQLRQELIWEGGTLAGEEIKTK